MKNLRYALPILLLAGLSFAPALVAQTATAVQPPVTKKVPHETKIHGLTLKDPVSGRSMEVWTTEAGMQMRATAIVRTNSSGSSSSPAWPRTRPATRS